MDIELSRLSSVEIPVQGEVLIRDDGGPQALERDGIRFPKPFHVEAMARRDGDLAVVHGRVSGQVLLECGRCLADVPLDVDAEFEARFAEGASALARGSRGRVPDLHAVLPSGPPGLPGYDGEDTGLRLGVDDLDVSFLPPGAHAIRLEDVAREQALLQMPLRPLCRPDCAGLCSRCGANLNAGPCGCPEETKRARDLRLSALEDLKRKLEKN